MATIRVSSNSQLSSAMRSAGSGDTIQLSGGTYSLSVRGENLSGATIKAASGANVTFSHVNLRDVSNLTFDGVDFKQGGTGKLFQMANSSNVTIRNGDFDGNGGGVGFWVNGSKNITLQNNQVEGFQTGFWLGGTTGLKVSNNKISDISLDGMIVGKVHDATISGNSITLDVKSGTKHTDGIQFYNSGSVNDPMTNVTVQNNRIETNNPASHGIYAANGLANHGGTSTYFRNVTIDHNTVVSAQVSGIAVGQTIGLKITNNILLQDTDLRSNAEIRTPVIRVDKESSQVTLSGNVTHHQPEASGVNWQPTDKGEPGWTIANNKIVSIGTSVRTAESLAPSAGASSSVGAAASSSSASSSTEAAAKVAVAPAAAAADDGQAETFRFDGNKATKGSGHVDGFDFAAGDKLALIHYDAGTFHGKAGGNYLAASLDGTFVKIDSYADLRELDQASSKVSVHADGDTLVIDIDQKGADHTIELAGLGHVYADLI